MGIAVGWLNYARLKTRAALELPRELYDHVSLGQQLIFQGAAGRVEACFSWQTFF